ncbi:MAG: hypothetical protein NTY83_01280 [Candidatus Micrarchaeota archaeon]|nr:hypothetical protein [Candidatus Micrarchaeota archaeon]
MKTAYLVFLVALLLFGCTGPKWETFTDDKFSMAYPAGTVQQTQGDEIFKVASEGCQISAMKIGNQASFTSFITYIKGTWENVNGLTIENEYVGQSSANFEVRASNESAQYKGSIKMLYCEGNNVYITIIGCGRDTYDSKKDMVDKIIDSVEC